MKPIVLLVLAVSLVAAPTAAAKQAPSFALWSAREQNHQDSIINPLEAGCKRLGDSKGGACHAKGLLIIYRMALGALVADPERLERRAVRDPGPSQG